MTIDYLTKRLLALGATQTGGFLVDCETFHSMPPLGKWSMLYFSVINVKTSVALVDSAIQLEKENEWKWDDLMNVQTALCTTMNRFEVMFIVLFILLYFVYVLYTNTLSIYALKSKSVKCQYVGLWFKITTRTFNIRGAVELPCIIRGVCEIALNVLCPN